MTTAPATSIAALLDGASPAGDGLALGIVTNAVRLSAADGHAPPARIQIAPRGRVAARDGRTFSFDPDLLVARFNADGIDIPVDLDHASAIPGAGDPRTVGWVRRLEARPDGIWADVEWLAEGEAVLKARTRRYVSPAIRHDGTGAVIWIHSVGLVAAPALSMGAIASASTISLTPEPLMKTVAASLGLAEAASETAILSAVTTLQAKSADADKAITTLTADLKAAEEKAARLAAEMEAVRLADHKAKVDRLLEAALTDKRIVPAEREAFARLAGTAEGLGEVETILKSRAPQLGASGLDSRVPPAPGGEDGVTLSARMGVYIAEQAQLGIHVSAVDALAHVRKA